MCGNAARSWTGSSLGGRRAEEDGYWELFHHNRTRVHPLTIPLSMSNAGASHISIKYGMQGPAYTVSDGVLFVRACDRPGVLDGALGHGSDGHRGRQ